MGLIIPGYCVAVLLFLLLCIIGGFKVDPNDWKKCEALRHGAAIFTNTLPSNSKRALLHTESRAADVSSWPGHQWDLHCWPLSQGELTNLASKSKAPHLAFFGFRSVLDFSFFCFWHALPKFTWCLDACIRERFVDGKRARELQGFLDGVKKGQEQVLG